MNVGYDGEARYFEEGVRSHKRSELLAKVGEELKIAYVKQLQILHSKLIASVKQDLAEAETSGTPFMEAARR